MQRMWRRERDKKLACMRVMRCLSCLCCMMKPTILCSSRYAALPADELVYFTYLSIPGAQTSVGCYHLLACRMWSAAVE